MLSKWSVEHPVAAVMFVLSFIALGLISIMRIGLELYPRFDFPAVSITTIYPGASPADVEEKVTKVIEEAVSSVPGVQQVQSDSSENMSNVVIMLAYGTDVQESLNKIRNEIDKSKRMLPADIEAPAASPFNLSAMPILSASLYGDLPLHEISEYATDNIENKIKQVNGVASVDVAGTSENQIIIDLDPAKMKELEITTEQVQGAISLYDLSMPLGKIETSDRSLSIRLSNKINSVDFLKNIIVRPYVSYEEMPSQKEIANNLRRSIQRQVGSQLAAMQQAQQRQMQQRQGLQGTPGQVPQAIPQQQSSQGMKFKAPSIQPKKKSLPQVTLGQVAQVAYKTTTPDVVSRINGKPAVRINIRKSDDANTVEVVNKVKDKLEKEKASFPGGMNYEIFSDQSKEINSSVGGTARGAMYAAVLATLVLIVFLRSFRSTLIIALSIPASVIATFMVIYFSGLTLNMVTLGGLALGIGMLVDNSIVVLENIFRHLESGADPKEAAKIGGQEVSGAITASTFTSIGVFLPILFISGMAKEWLGPLAVVVISSLAFSLLVALTLVPMLAAKFYSTGRKFSHKSGGGALDMRKMYAPIVNFAIDHKYIVVLIMLLAVVFTGYAARSIGSNLMPDSGSQEVVFVNIEMPSAASQSAGLKVASQIEDKIIGISDIKNLSTDVGVQINSMGQKPPMVSINAWLKAGDDRKESLDSIVEAVKKETAGISGAKEIIVRGGSVGLFGGNQSALAINISGPSLDELEKLTNQFKDKIGKVEGIDNISTSLDDSKPEYMVSVNNKLAMENSVQMTSIAELIRIATHGKEITKLKNGSGEQEKIVLKMSKASSDLNQIKSIPIQTKDEYEPIGNYISIAEGKSLKSIFRSDRNRTMTLFVDFDKDKVTLSEKAKEVEDAIMAVKLPDGYEYTFGGEMEDMAEVFGQLSQAMLLAVVLIYMLMAAQFGSLKNPFIIMFTVPLAAIGVVLGLKLSSTSFSMIVFLGSITLTGIVVNNGIVLIDVINILRARGSSVKEAIIEASLQRLRPIIMTAATTVLAMAPVAMHIGGKQMMAPMAVTIMGGLTFSTVLSLVFIPALYSIMNRDKRVEPVLETV